MSDISRELAFQAYINEITPNGNSRLDNIILSLCTDERREQHVATQIDMAFQAGWRAALDAAPQAAVVKPLVFGAGALVIDTGTYADKPAVFIAPAKYLGEVGASAKRENHPLDSLIDGETVMVFPTMEQAKIVADALCNAFTPSPLSAAVAYERAAAEIENSIQNEWSDGTRTTAQQHSFLIERMNMGKRAAINKVRALSAEIPAADLLKAALALPEVAALVEAAYREGWSDGATDRDHDYDSTPAIDWLKSDTLAALVQP